MGIEPATPTPLYFDPNAYPSVLNPISCKIETLKIFFFLKFLLDTCPFVGPLIPLFRTSGDVSSGFQSQSGFCLIRTLRRHMWYTFPEIHLWCNISAGVYSQHSSQSPSPHVCFSRGVMPGFEPPTSCSAVWCTTHSAMVTGLTLKIII